MPISCQLQHPPPALQHTCSDTSPWPVSRQSLTRRATRGLSLILSVLLASGHLAGTVAHARPGTDLTPPVIRIAPLGESTAERRQAFTAQVSDEQQLAEVILFVRREGEKLYQPLLMTSLGTSQFYNISIDTDPTDLRTLQYYVEAHDAAGNRGISGYSFAPYTRALIPAAVALAGYPATRVGTEADQGSTGRIRWWTVALGVLAAGTVAALVSSGGGGDSNDSDGNSGGVPLSINIQEP